MAADAEDAVRRRRERGRRSQAGFRKRQAETHQRMEEQNRRLKSAVEKLVHAICGDERPELLNAISNVAEAAGIDAQRPTQSDTAAQSGAEDPSGNPQIIRAPAVDGEEDISIDATTRDLIRKAGDQTISSPSSLGSPSALPRRLNCGIWLDHLHYMRVSIPPDDIIPYLGPGSKTFAGIIFWSMLDHAQKKCPRKHSEVSTLHQRALGHSKVTKDMTITYIQAMADARLEYKRTGSISPEYASAAERDLGMVMRDRIAAEYRARGMDPDQWVSSKGVEKRVRSMAGDGTFVALEIAARGGGDPALRDAFEMIKCRLYEICICFGDGPRWRVEIVDELFSNLVHMAFWSIQ